MRKTIVLTCMLFLVAPATRAENPRPNANMWELGGFLGIVLPDSDHQLLDRSNVFQSFDKLAFDVGLRVSYLPLSWLGLEVEGALIPTSTRDSDDSALLGSFRGHLLLQYPAWISPFVVGGAGGWGISSSELGTDMDLYPHWGVGAKVYATRSLAVRLDGRHIIGSNLEHDGWVNHFEVLVGLSWVIGMDEEKQPPKDSDGDGITDNRDKCPDQAANTPDGCPPKDTDGDGVTDDRDKCPSQAANTPDGCPPKDTDGDGVTDDRDKCPDQPANTPDGCPPRDTDGDGIPDAKDRCPDKKGTAQFQGCPDTDGDGLADGDDACPSEKGPADLQGCPDRDGDGIADKDDKCPDTPGLKEKQGCMPEEAKKFSGSIQGIKFASGKAEITPDSATHLDEVVGVLTEYPSIHLRIEGHTDSVGNAEKNQTLSQARADAVRNYLIGKGIEADRLESEGFGETKPIQDNKTARGRAANRRIEFKISSR